jgi:hypothetical protein
VLRLTLDRDTYEQLGLTGSESHFKPRASRYNVSIDLRAAAFSAPAGSKQRERVLWCLSKRVPVAELWVYWTSGEPFFGCLRTRVRSSAASTSIRWLCSDDGKCGEVKFPDGVRSQRCDCEAAMHEFEGVDLPDAKVLLFAASQSCFCVADRGVCCWIFRSSLLRS